MIIYLNDKGIVDFQAPIYLSYHQKIKFIQGMKEIFGDELEIKEIVENRKEIQVSERKSKKFDVDSLSVLANSDLDNSEAAKKLGKTEFAVQMKRGNYLKELFEFSKKKGKLTEEEIEEFINTRQPKHG